MSNARERPPLPPGLRIVAGDEADGGGYRDAPKERPLVIDQRTTSPRHLFGLVFMIAWLAGVAWMLYASDGEGLVFAVVLGVLGLGGLYWSLADVLNKKRFTVSDGTIEITNGPLPLLGNRAVRIGAIRQLVVQRVSHRTRSKKVGRYSWTLYAETSEQTVELLSGLTESDQADYLEHAIEQRLGIIDQPERSKVPDDE